MTAAIEDQVLDYDPDDLDPDDLELAEGADDLPELEPSQYPATNPAEHNVVQDPFGAFDPAWTREDELFLAGELGGPGENPIPPAEALKSMMSHVRQNVSIKVGYCLYYQRTERGVGPLYGTAKEACLAIPREFLHPIHDWSKVPRGVILYTPEHQYGHVWSSLGAGQTVTTDWPSGKWGKVAGATLLSSWGYDQAYWSPMINDVRVWTPNKPAKPKPKPKPEDYERTRGEWFDAEIRRLVRKRKLLHENDRHATARIVNDAIQQLLRVDVRRVLVEKK